jgi:nucleotide-binding universal stress UspA family protein
VRAWDWDRSIHFPYNDVTDVLLRLRFTSGQPLEDASQIGQRLLSIPQLTPGDVEVMEAFQQKVLSERTVFLSYACHDVEVAALLEQELEARGIHVWRDETSLRAGEAWEAALKRAVRSADCVIVLVSPASAESDVVRRELHWATSEMALGDMVECIVPVLLPSGGWDAFVELHAFRRVDYPAQPDTAFFDSLASHLGGGLRQPKQ